MSKGQAIKAGVCSARCKCGRVEALGLHQHGKEEEVQFTRKRKAGHLMDYIELEGLERTKNGDTSLYYSGSRLILNSISGCWNEVYGWRWNGCGAGEGYVSSNVEFYLKSESFDRLSRNEI